jgi:hypothetical protein
LDRNPLTISPGRRAHDVLSWSRRFEHPVPGLATLRDAADYIQKLLSKPEQQLPHWQTAVEALIIAAELRRQQSR